MKSLWDDAAAAAVGDDPLALRVYSSRLLGRDPSLVLHGGGNTSVKASAADMFGDLVDVLFVKGSGWDLATIEAAGFAPVRMDALRRLAEREGISDTVLVRAQRAAMTDPTAPDPSVEAVLHALIPFTYVDHTHADAVVALTNSPNGRELVDRVYGDTVMVVPYIMPGFPLARAVFERSREVDWSKLEGMILLNHGIFTWGNTARESYERMIRLVGKAEEYLASRGAMRSVRTAPAGAEDLVALARIRRAVSDLMGQPMVAKLTSTDASRGFASLANVASIATRGPLTPDHVIRTKPIPVVLRNDPPTDVREFGAAYRHYFERNADETKRMLDLAPRWAVWPGQGTITFGRTMAQARIATDIVEHTVAAIQWAEALGGWNALPEKDLFDVEYWELEQAKLAKAGAGRPFDGRVALVTGAASGIGLAVATELAAQGAAVLTADRSPMPSGVRGETAHVVCDLAEPDAPARIAAAAVRAFGGLDVVVSNVGTFPPSQRLEAIESETWERAFSLNVTSHQRLLTACVPFLKTGVSPAVVVVGSKNVPAPGPAQAAYSASKAALTQLARVAALELASDRIRVNVVHPNAVFDTGLWTDDVLRARAAAYGKSVDEYKRSNLLGVEVTSATVASVVVALASNAFACTTGAQIPVDGGNDRVV